VSLTDEGSVVEGDSMTIVSTLRYSCVGGGYADGGEAVVFDGEGYLCGFCVDGVFNKFFEGGEDIED